MSKGLGKSFSILRINRSLAGLCPTTIYLPLHLQNIQLLANKKQGAMMQDLYSNNEGIC